jgi:hypothetical protein
MHLQRFMQQQVKHRLQQAGHRQQQQQLAATSASAATNQYSTAVHVDKCDSFSGGVEVIEVFHDFYFLHGILS